MTEGIQTVFRKSLATATVVTVAIGTMQLPAAAQPVPGDVSGGAAVDGCATATRAPTPALEKAARAGQTRIVCFTQKPPPGVTRTPARTPQGPAKTPAQKRSDLRTAAVDCPQMDWAIERFETCTAFGGFITIDELVCGPTGCFPVQVGWIEVEGKFRSKTRPNQGNWDVQLEMTGIDADGEGHEGANVTGAVGCERACIPLHGTFPSQLLRIGHTVSGSGVVRTTIGGSSGVQGFGHATIEVDIAPVRPGLPGTKVFRVEPVVRCAGIAVDRFADAPRPSCRSRLSDRC